VAADLLLECHWFEDLHLESQRVDASVYSLKPVFGWYYSAFTN